MQTLPRGATVGVASPLGRLTALLARLAATDFTRPRAAVALAFVFVLTRAPLLPLGYGADADAWRVATTARWLWAHGDYLPSRLPGYPLHELTSALLIGGGPLATNSATMVVSFIGVLCFAGIVRRCQVQPAGLVTLTMAFTPLLWINSTVTMDYMWGLTCVLGAYLLLLDRRVIAAGIVLGLAAGCRPISLAFLGPLLLLPLRARDLPAAGRFAGATLATALVALAPVWLRYGGNAAGFADWRPTWGQIARTLGVETASLLTLTGLGLVLLLSLPQLLRLPGRVRRDAQLGVWLCAVLLIFAVFMRLPLEEGYLLPLLPFLVLVLARTLRRALFVAACAAIVAGGFVDIHTASEEGWTSPTAILYLRPDRGRLLVDHALRQQRVRVVEEARAYPLPANSVLVMGYYYPMMVERYHGELDLRFREQLAPRIIGPLTDITAVVDTEHNRSYVWLLNEGQMREYRRQGIATYTMDYDSKVGLKVEQTIPPERDRFGPR